LNPLLQIIFREIQKNGVIPFARFMQMALYCPVYGYYEAEKDIGRRGDFFTSVSVGALFGELLAFQFAEWLEPLLTTAENVHLVESGAHDGQLAKDILTALRRKRTGLFDRLQYVLVEPSARLRVRQKENLAEFASRLCWMSGWEGFARQRCVRGVIFSNELLDALPVHRIGWDAAQRNWFEWGVNVRDQRFVWEKIPNSFLRFPRLPSELIDVLPDGFTTELSSIAEHAWCSAADVLAAGRLMTMDYGLDADDFFRPERSNGTVRGYYRHHLADDPLANVGEQDLTAHVNFTAVQSAGESAGLKTEMLAPQEIFFTRIAEQTWKRPTEFEEWTPARKRQFQTLIHPEHLGRSFRVLVQTR
jgi:SAM-dependent MidA family methyltransferase